MDSYWYVVVVVACLLLPVGTVALPVDTSSSPPQDNADPVYEMFRNFAGSFPTFGNPFSYIPNGFYGPRPAPGQFPFGGTGMPFPFGQFPGQFPGQLNPFGLYPGQFPTGGGGGMPYGQMYPGQFPGRYPSAVSVRPQSGGQITFGRVGNTIYPILNGIGYSGPNQGSGSGVPNPNYGNVGGALGGVPIVSTRFQNVGGAAAIPPLGPTSTSTVSKDTNGNQAAVSVQAFPGDRPVLRTQTVRGPNSFGTAFAFANPPPA